MTASPLPIDPLQPGVDPVRLRASRPADLLAVVPYLLGFHPADSLVALLLREGRVLLTARCDLAPGGPPGDAGPVEVDHTVQELVDQHAPSGLVIVVYCSDIDRGRSVLRAQADHLTGVDLVDALLVDGARWWSLLCERGCCPPEGTPYAPDDHPLSAEAVGAGLVARGGRDDVVARVAGPPPSDWPVLRRQVRAGRGTLRRVPEPDRADALLSATVDALPRVDPAAVPAGVVSRAGRRLDDEACLTLALLVQETGVRDVACALITREDARRHVSLWQEVVARTPPELASAPVSVLGIAAWAEGNGTLLNACCARLGELDPGYPMARLLSDVSLRALPPAWWDAMADGLRRDLGIAG